MTNESTRWVRGGELAQLLGVTPGRVSQLVASKVIKPGKREGRTVLYDADASIEAYRRSVMPTTATMDRHQELQQRLQQRPLTTAELLADDDVDDLPPAPLMDHGLSAVLTMGHTALWWEQLTQGQQERQDIEELLQTELGQRVMRRAAAAVQVAVWGGVADGIVGVDAESLTILEEEARPLLQQVEILRQVAVADGIDPDRPLTQWDYIAPPWQRPRFTT